MEGDELTPEVLQTKLHNYQRAIREEFEKAADSEPENIIEYTRDYFEKNVPMAAAQIVFLAGNSDSDTVRGNMSKFIIEYANRDAEGRGDPIKDLLRQLNKKKDKEPANS